jgi:hypothetical protein
LHFITLFDNLENLDYPRPLNPHSGYKKAWIVGPVRKLGLWLGLPRLQDMGRYSQALPMWSWVLIRLASCGVAAPYWLGRLGN